MSFTDDFLKQLQKRTKKIDNMRVTSPYSSKNSQVSSGTRQSSDDDFTSAFLEEMEKRKQQRLEAAEKRKQEEEEEDIAPLPDTSERVHGGGSGSWDSKGIDYAEGQEEDRTWFSKGAFEDGFDILDIPQAISGTADDIRGNLIGGLLGIVEGTVDAGATLVGGVGKLFGADEFAEKTKGFISQDLIDEEKIAKSIVNGTNLAGYFLRGGKDVDEVSVLGEKSDSLVQSGGQLLGTAALQSVGVPWWVTSGTTSFGSGSEEAFKQDASYGEAVGSAAISAGAEILTEKLFGGSGLGEKGLFDIGALTRGISNKLFKSLADFGVDIAAEGMEEVASQIAGNLGSALYREENLGELLLSEEALDGYIESFIGGAVLGGGANVGNVTNSIRNKTDYRTGLDAQEEAVFNHEYEKRIKEAENGGKKLSKNDKAKIYDEVMEDLEKGRISVDTIEEVLGGETYKSYRDTVDSEDALVREYDELGDLKESELTVKQRKRLNELEAQIEDNKKNSQRDWLQRKYKNEVLEVVRGSRLQESYNETARRREAFTADLSKYDEKQKAVVQKAIDSGILNNTNRTHELVDIVAKISADKGVLFDFTNNAKLKESGFAIEGKTVNGYVTKDGITINMSSPKAWQSTVGHEITHVLEGTELYTELQNALFDYAKTKGDYQGRLDTLTKLYEGIKDADVNAELTADLVGDYLFTDPDFVNHLSTKHRNVFQKIYDEVKYLWKVATAGSKEARELEKVKHAFEQAYKAQNKSQTDTKHSITEAFTDSDGNHYDNAVLLDTDFFDGISPRNWGEKLQAEVNRRASDNPFILPIVDENGNTTILQFAGPNETVRKNGGSEHKVVDELSRTSDNISKLAVIHIDEIVSVSEENAPYFTEGNEHGWLDKNGWLHRNANVINQKNGNIYNLTVDIAKAADGRTILYATKGKIKKVGTVKVDSLKIKGPRQNSDSGDSISQNSEKSSGSVKNSLSEAQNEFQEMLIAAQDMASEARGYGRRLSVNYDGSVTVYHGTSKENAEKIQSTGMLNEGTFFTTSKKDAEYYAKTKNKGGVVLELKLDARNLEFAAAGDELYSAVKLKNTNGIYKSDKSIQYSLSDSEGNTLSENQADYFKDSVVRDEDGNLKVMYHGTSQGGHTVFDTYGSNYGLFGAGSYFTDSKSISKGYTKKGKGNSPQVYESYLNITNPMDMDAQADPSAWQKAFPDASFPESGTNEDFYRAMEDYFEDNEYSRGEAADMAMEALEGMGYDGITHIGGGRVNADGERHQVYIAFHPEQIKDVGNASPTSDPDIRYSISEDSEGNPLSEGQIEFFKASKVRDENGNLLKVYHGSKNSGFNVFKYDTNVQTGTDYGEAYYFTSDRQKASGYSYDVTKDERVKQYSNDRAALRDKFLQTRSEEDKNAFLNYKLDGKSLGDLMNDESYLTDGGEVKEVYLNITNPLIVDAGGRYYYEVYPGYFEQARSNGNDGIIVKNVIDNPRGEARPINTYIAFAPYQIKSVNNTNPTSDTDIRYSMSEDSDGNALSDGQKKFFKDTKAVDRNGNLLKVYHTTKSDFTVFDDSKKGSATEAYNSYLGHFFTDDPEYMSNFPEFEGGQTQAYYLNMTNPIDMNSISREAFLDIVEVTGGDVNEAAEIYDREYEAETERAKLRGGTPGLELSRLLEELTGEFYTDSEFHEVLRPNYDKLMARGYDGIINNMDGAGWANEYVVLNSNQAKLTTNTDPTADADVRYSITEYTPEEKKAHNKAVLEHFGKTYKWAETGYLLLDGTKLDLSGKHDGAPGGYRTVDHRDITEALGYDYGGEDYSGSLIQFMSEGNIRIIPESNGINLSVPPTKAQEQALADYISRFRGEVMLDIDDTNGRTVVSVEYPYGTHSGKVLRDIREWFENGTRPEVSSLSQFRYSLSEDSEGNALSDVQKEFFKDSKIVDGNGNLLVMYHGTPNGDFSVFRDGTYFTPNKEYADRYQNPGASSISAGKTATNPKTFAVYLDIKKPFDISDPEARQIYINDYIKGGNAMGINPYLSDAEYSKIDSVDWTEGEDLREFLIENGYDYDGLVLDEGADGGYGDDVQYRGKSYVVFSPNQIKEVSNKRPTNSDDIYNSLSWNGEAPINYGAFATPARDLLLESAPVREDVAPVQDSVQDAPQELFPDDYAPMSEEETAARQSEVLDSLTDADAPPEVEAPYYGELDDTVTTPYDPFEDRDMSEVGNRKVKAYMYENPEVKPFFQEAATYMLGDLESSTKGEKWFDDKLYYETNGEQGWGGTTRQTASDIAYLLDNFGYTYDQIRKGLNAIIEDNGAENNAVSKRIEFLLHDRLANGWQDFFDGTEIPPNQEYINLLNEKQIAEYSEEARQKFFETADQYAPPADDFAPIVESAPAAEATEDIAPVAEEYEAIRPQRQAAEPMDDDIAPVYGDRLVRRDTERPGEKQRKWVETSTESEAVNRGILPDDLDQTQIHYEPIPNKTTLGNANARLDKMGYEASVQYFNSQFAGKKITLDDVALGERLIQEAMKRGDTKTAGELIQNVAILGTELGQKVQALSIIKRLTPEGQLKMLQKTVERGKTKGDKAYEGVEFTQEMIDEILRVYGKDGTYDQEKLNEAVEKVKKKIADQMKVTKMDKANAWRYLSMLGNPKTHIRNLVSNVAMKGTVAVKNVLARTIESVAPIKNRTKTWRSASEEVKAFAQKTTAEMKDILSDGGKYSEDASIKQKRQIFKNKILNGLYEFNSDMLSKEDWWFSRPAFTSALSEYLTANGIRTEEDIKNNPKVIEKAKLYATEQSQIATFRQYSWLSNKINDIESHNAATQMAVGAVLPFKKTPINIAKTGLNYSPLGFAKTLTYDISQVKKGKMEASELVDHLSQNITGSALTLVGYMLASTGLLSGGGEDDKEGEYDYQLGEQSYAVNIGGQSYSLSWLSPVAMPLFVGANAYEQLVEGKEWNGDVVVETLAQTLDPLSEMSFLSGLNQVLSSYDSGLEKFAGIGESMVQNYVTQFVPTLSSQVATVMDDTKRSTKVAADSDFRFFDETINKLKLKIPGLRETLEPSTDIWGNEVKQTENVMTRAFETFLAPYARKENIATEIDAEIKALYSQTGDTGIIPSVPYNYVNYKDEKYEMSASEFTAYKKTYGQTAYNLMEELFGTEIYQSSSSEEKAKMVNDVYDYARDVAKQEFLAGRGITYTNAKADGEEYYREDPIRGAIENNMTPDEYSFSAAYPEKYAFFKEIGVSYADYEAADEDGKRAYTWAYENPSKYQVSKVIADDLMVYRQYTSDLYDLKADKDSDGKTINGSRKEKVIDYINNMDADYGQKIILFKTEYPADDTYNSEIVDYLNSRSDISYKDMETILKELGFTVRSDGTVLWD